MSTSFSLEEAPEWSFISGPGLDQVHPPELSPSRHVPEFVVEFTHRVRPALILGVQSLIGSKSLRTLFRALLDSPSSTFGPSFGQGPSFSYMWTPKLVLARDRTRRARLYKTLTLSPDLTEICALWSNDPVKSLSRSGKTRDGPSSILSTAAWDMSMLSGLVERCIAMICTPLSTATAASITDSLVTNSTSFDSNNRHSTSTTWHRYLCIHCMVVLDNDTRTNSMHSNVTASLTIQRVSGQVSML